MLDPSLSTDTSIEGDRYVIALGQLLTSEDQPRKHFNPQKMQELTESVKTHGILEPLIVRPIDDNLYELVAGERRYRAAQAAGLHEVPVVVRALTREEALQLALVENLQREDLNVVEETESLIMLLSLRLNQPVKDIPSLLHRLAKSSDNVVGTADEYVLEQIQDVFQAIGTLSWTSFATHRLPLLNLPPHLLEALRSGQIAYTKARAIAKLKETKRQQNLLKDAIKGDLSLRDIQSRIESLADVPQETSVPEPVYAPSLDQRCADLSRQLRRKKTWNNDSKRKRVEKLIAELEAILMNDDDIKSESSL
ncbi:MAG: ParB/RepB/Spo0J family partition protein [Leptolyngbya sp. DLM2.Bin15]|nr:MAG: ParB/RepB/Spo0J family partition protein [Leptolyngbya sp. DLM2.Bin15]